MKMSKSQIQNESPVFVKSGANYYKLMGTTRLLSVNIYWRHPSIEWCDTKHETETFVAETLIDGDDGLKEISEEKFQEAFEEAREFLEEKK